MTAFNKPTMLAWCYCRSVERGGIRPDRLKAVKSDSPENASGQTRPNAMKGDSFRSRHGNRFGLQNDW